MANEREETSADADMGLGIPRARRDAREQKDDPSSAPEEEGSATRTDGNRQLLDAHKTDESGAPVDDG